MSYKSHLTPDISQNILNNKFNEIFSTFHDLEVKPHFLAKNHLLEHFLDPMNFRLWIFR